MRLAIVIPWFGRELKGGAEQHAWQLAARLAARGHDVEVLTTCCRSHQDDWTTNHLPAGVTKEPEGFGVHRFPVDSRDVAGFDRVCRKLLSFPLDKLRPGVSPVSAHDSRLFTAELIRSRALLDFIAAKSTDYHRLIFLPYLYGPIIDGVALAGSRAALLPCLHDEAYAYLPEVAETFRRAGSLLFISEGEQQLAYRLFGPGIIPKSTFAGAGVESAPVSSEAHLSERITGEYVLYLGRKDAGKNVPLLIAGFRRFRAVRPNSTLQLVLAGYGEIALDSDAFIIDLGLVSDAEKEHLLENCIAAAQPSQNESFSRVIMEAWLHGKPVAVHARCLATATAVQSANGGWTADSERDWAAMFVELDRLTPDQRNRVGENGRAYASNVADWEKVIDRYEDALAGPVSKQVASKSAVGMIKVNQFLPNLTYGDAISNEALWIRSQLRNRGFASEIYVRHIDARVAHECGSFSPATVHDSDALIYHHSIGTDITSEVVNFSGPKCLIYHNITPAEFFEPFRPDFAGILREGRRELSRLALYFPVSFGDSTLNQRELIESGFHDPQILPICVSPAKWDSPVDRDVMREMQDGRMNILFVGRIAPNKRQDELLLAFTHFREHDPLARLILVGSSEGHDPYAAYIRDIVTSLKLENCVTMPGSVSDAQLAAYYRTASLLWSMSEHEGFCVPLIESMWFDLPVFAFQSTAIAETAGDASYLFEDKSNLSAVADEAYRLLSNHEALGQIISAQRKQRLRYLPDSIMPFLNALIDRLVPAEGKTPPALTSCRLT